MLEQSKRISKSDLEEALVQMELYAIKDSVNLSTLNVKRQLRAFKKK